MFHRCQDEPGKGKEVGEEGEGIRKDAVPEKDRETGCKAIAEEACLALPRRCGRVEGTGCLLQKGGMTRLLRLTTHTRATGCNVSTRQ